METNIGILITLISILVFNDPDVKKAFEDYKKALENKRKRIQNFTSPAA